MIVTLKRFSHLCLPIALVSLMAATLAANDAIKNPLLHTKVGLLVMPIHLSKHLVRAWALPMILLFTASNLAAQKRTAAQPRETVLFPFDDYALPFSKGLVLTLAPGHKSDHSPSLGVDPEHPGTPVMPIGKKGDPDFPRASFCGTILKVVAVYVDEPTLP